MDVSFRGKADIARTCHNVRLASIRSMRERRKRGRAKVGDAFDVLWARVVKPNECITSCSVKRFFELDPSQNFYKILTLTRRQEFA